jgi:hypothetical protein
MRRSLRQVKKAPNPVLVEWTDTCCHTALPLALIPFLWDHDLVPLDLLIQR